MSIFSSSFARGLLLTGLVATASGLGCLDDEKVEPAKGEVDQSSPPGPPEGVASGKADGATTYPVSFESTPHPYANNTAKSFTFNLGTVVPSCTSAVRLHFAALRTEANYDFVKVLHADGTSESFTGNKDNAWSAQFAVSGDTKPVSVRLESDYSVTDYGFRIDSVEPQLRLICPLGPITICQNGNYDVTPVPGECQCRGMTQCTLDNTVEIEHSIGGGFTGQVTGHRLVGTTGSNVTYMPGQPDSVTAIGAIDHSQVQQLITLLMQAHYLDRTTASTGSNWNETFRVKLGTRQYSLSLPQGSFTAADQQLIQAFEALFGCSGTTPPLTCGAGFGCSAEGACVPAATCICPQIYQPVCGADGHTYGNSCTAGCAHATVIHTGECGAVGDTCGTIRGLICTDPNKCRYAASTYAPPFPDAGGACVASNYCDAAGDCAAVPHPAVPGSWACEANTCNWKAGASWLAVTGFAFSTPHPYTNNQNVWQALNLPSGATKMRLVNSGTFALENGYDKLEVWVWQNNAWVKVKTFTGSVAPALTDEFVGTKFNLHFVSDVSVTQRGFDLTAQYSM